MPQVSPRAQKEAEWNIQTEGNAAVTYRLQAWPHQPGTHMPFDGQSSGPLVKRPTLELCVLQPFFCPSWGRLTGLKVPEGKDHRYPPVPKVAARGAGGASCEATGGCPWASHLRLSTGVRMGCLLAGAWPAEDFAWMWHVSWQG